MWSARDDRDNHFARIDQAWSSISLNWSIAEIDDQFAAAAQVLQAGPHQRSRKHEPLDGGTEMLMKHHRSFA